MIPRQRIALFATMQPSDQPFPLTGDDVWELEADSVRFDGNGHGKLELPLSYGNDVRIAVGATIATETNAGAQHQLSLAADAAANQPLDYVEFNQADTIHVASITNFDGVTASISTRSPQLYPTACIRVTSRCKERGPSVRRSRSTVAGLVLPSSVYNGFVGLVLNVNNLVINVRSVIVIESY